jgi:DNA-directed RNA polymerase specialized sigma24 family protein
MEVVQGQDFNNLLDWVVRRTFPECRRRFDQDDFKQELRLRALQRYNPNRGRLSTFLYMEARAVVKELRKRRKREAPLSGEGLHFQVQPLRGVFYTVLANQIEVLIRAKDEDSAEIFRHMRTGMTFTEAGGLLGLTPGQARMRFYRTILPTARTAGKFRGYV